MRWGRCNTVPLKSHSCIHKAFMSQAFQQHPSWQSGLCESPSSGSLQHLCVVPQSPSDALSEPQPHQTRHCPASSQESQGVASIYCKAPDKVWSRVVLITAAAARQQNVTTSIYMTCMYSTSIMRTPVAVLRKQTCHSFLTEEHSQGHVLSRLSNLLHMFGQFKPKPPQ